MQPDTTQTDTIRLLKKQLFFTRLIALLLAVTMAVLLATAAILLPQAQDILKDVNTVSRQLAAVDWARMAQEIENLALTSRESVAEVLLQVQKLDLVPSTRPSRILTRSSPRWPAFSAGNHRLRYQTPRFKYPAKLVQTR